MRFPERLLGRDLDPRPGRRVAAHTLLTLLHHQLRDPRSTNSPHRNSSCSVNCCSSSKNSPAFVRLMPKRSAKCVNSPPWSFCRTQPSDTSSPLVSLGQQPVPVAPRPDRSTRLPVTAALLPGGRRQSTLPFAGPRICSRTIAPCTDRRPRPARRRFRSSTDYGYLGNPSASLGQNGGSGRSSLPCISVSEWCRYPGLRYSHTRARQPFRLDCRCGSGRPCNGGRAGGAHVESQLRA